jgi:hypothetical protein
MAAFDVTLGQYSNFTSFECVAKGGSLPVNKAPTLCGSAAFPNSPNISRVLIPRFGISGFVVFPGFPVILGFDANLAQYGLPGTPNNIDTLNKPGNDVRIYVGYTFDLSTVIKNSFSTSIKKFTGQ